jgi:hypothetical protein
MVDAGAAKLSHNRDLEAMCHSTEVDLFALGGGTKVELSVVGPSVVRQSDHILSTDIESTDIVITLYALVKGERQMPDWGESGRGFSNEFA